jgi:hypothetical protein
MHTASLTGADLSYWVARANMQGHPQERNVCRSQYGLKSRNDPISEPSMREFVFKKIGPVLPERSAWH